MTRKSVRLRFVVKLPLPAGDGSEPPQKRRGRTPSYKPLLVAIDAICRRGVSLIESEEEVIQAKILKRGRRPAHIPTSPYEKLKTSLARNWHVTEDAVHEYLWDARFYSAYAATLVNDLLRSKRFSPRLRVDEIAFAVGEHYPRNRDRARLPIASEGIELNVFPSIRQPQQKSRRPGRKRKSVRKRQKP